MKKIINIVILLPLLLYVILLLVNTNLLSQTQEVNFFWVYKTQIPLLAFVSVFFILYILLFYFQEKISLFFLGSKTRKLEKHTLELKAKLSDKTPEIISKIENKFEDYLEKIKQENQKNLELAKKQTDKILGNLEYEVKSLKEKIENLKK